MKILYYAVGKNHVELDVPNELKTFQDLVGGYIQSVKVNDRLMIVCHEDGRLIGLPPNGNVNGLLIVGNFFVTRFNGIDDFTDLTDEDIKLFIDRYEMQ